MSEELLLTSAAPLVKAVAKSAPKRAAATKAKAASIPVAKTPEVSEAKPTVSARKRATRAVADAAEAPAAPVVASPKAAPAASVAKPKRAPKKPAKVEAPAPEAPAQTEMVLAPARVTDIHSNLAAAAQSTRQHSAPPPVVEVAPVAEAAESRPVVVVEVSPPPVQSSVQPDWQPQPLPADGQPRGRFNRRQRWKERRAQEREQRGQGQAPVQSVEGAVEAEAAEAQTQQPRHPQGQQGRHQQGQQGQPQGRHQQGRQPQQGQRNQDNDRDRGRGRDRDRDRDRDRNRGGESEQDRDRDREPEVLQGPPEAAEGILELSPKGHGFLRLREKLYAQMPNDVFVHADLIRKFALRDGMCLKGEAKRSSRGMQMSDVTTVNNRKPEEIKDLPLFEELKATNPCKRYQLETKQSLMTTRVIDMMTPVGRGQRGLIVAPPRAGKTTLLQHIAEAMIANYPQVHVMVLLVDERPEEVTEFRRVLPQAEVYASSNDSDVKSHTRIAQFAVERAKRLVEMGDHVFILLDSITRMARAFNNANSGGATMSGGMGVGNMEIPRRLFAAARNTKTAGSLTILATALIETGSKMDDMIFAEFKGTGNMELVLDRKIAEQFIFPAVNIFKSGTRREELLLPAFQIEKIHMLRRGLAGHKPIEAIQRVISLLERYPTNTQMLLELPSK